MLNANVGFLNSAGVSSRSPIQMASYMSLVASLGSMILGLLLASHARTIGQSMVLQQVSNYAVSSQLLVLTAIGIGSISIRHR